MTRRLAASMGKLQDHGNFRILTNRRQHGPECRLGGIVPQTEIAGGNPAIGLHGRRFDHQHASARHSQLSQMRDMPCVGQAVLSAVLAHWRHDDAVGECQTAQRDWGEQ
jgi:hypothetical protein